MRQRLVRILATAACAALPLAGCGHGPVEHTGLSCTAADECYPGVDRQYIQGDVVCMDRVVGGYCTHHCVADGDCCAAAGECPGGFPEVCAPFESTDELYCFLSCEGVADETAFCQTNASPAFNCRSTGGGSENRKVCVP